MGENMKYRINHKNARLRRLCAPVLCFTALVFWSSVVSPPAWSFETFDVSAMLGRAVLTTDDINANLVTRSSPSSIADKCLPLLNSVSLSGPSSVMDQTQRPAGKAAALALVFGVRFALGPAEQPRISRKSQSRNKARLDIWQPHGTSVGDRSALTVSAYRHCRKEQALQALSDFHWRR